MNEHEKEPFSLPPDPGLHLQAQSDAAAQASASGVADSARLKRRGGLRAASGINPSSPPPLSLKERGGSRAALGRVWLIGAGPGDPELLTLKAARAIAAADVILLDDLVNRAVLEHASPGARVIAVGKRGGCRSTPQAFIEKLMLREARAGRSVVRLKGGDPFLFGRGGEEIAHLQAAGIDVEVVPGITSGLAAPMAAGIPVTHRDTSPGVIFVTGHEKDEARERIDWSALARSGLTLLVYMGVANAAKIERRLIDGGLAPSTPIAAIQSATLPEQRIACGTLATLSLTLAQQGISSPAILVIGEVARSAQHALAAATDLESQRAAAG